MGCEIIENEVIISEIEVEQGINVSKVLISGNLIASRKVVMQRSRFQMF